MHATHVGFHLPLSFSTMVQGAVTNLAAPLGHLVLCSLQLSVPQGLEALNEASASEGHAVLEQRCIPGIDRPSYGTGPKR